MNVLAAVGCDGMRYIFVFGLKEMGVSAPSGLGRGSGEIGSALIAVTRPNDIPMAAMRTGFLDSPGRHCHKITLIPLDDFDVSDNETVIKGNRRERPELLIRPFPRKNPNLRDFHGLERVTDDGRFRPSMLSDLARGPLGFLSG